MEDYQKERATILFREFPEIKRAYELSCNFRNWIKRENIGKDETQLIEEIKTWYKDIYYADIEGMLNFKNLVERNLSFIVNYFEKELTNADTEAFNSKLKLLKRNIRGIKDKKVFFFRMLNYFA